MKTRRDFLLTGVSLAGAMAFTACGPADATGKASDKAVAPRQEGKVVKVQVYNKSGQLVLGQEFRQRVRWARRPLFFIWGIFLVRSHTGQIGPELSGIEFNRPLCLEDSPRFASSL